MIKFVKITKLENELILLHKHRYEEFVAIVKIVKINNNINRIIIIIAKSQSGKSSSLYIHRKSILLGTNPFQFRRGT